MRSSCALLLLGLSACGADPLAPAGREDARTADAAQQDAGVGSADASAPFDAEVLDPWPADAAFEDAAPDAGSASDASVLDASAPDAEILRGSDGGPTRYPLLLLHGWAASPTFLGYGDVARTLRASGYTATAAAVPSFASAEARGADFARAIDRYLAATGAAKVNVIAHSMGGLDTRYAISTLHYGDRIATLSTVSTPHGGTSMADVILGLQPGAADRLVDAVATVFGATIRSASTSADVRASLVSLSEARVTAFDAANPDDPRVHYQSWAGLANVFGLASPNDDSACDHLLLFDPAVRATMSPQLIPIAAIVAHGLQLLPNDGLVAVVHAKHGRFRGCIPTDHLGEVGNAPRNPVTGFDLHTFYVAMAAELAAAGY